jgi:beta-mannanase
MVIQTMLKTAPASLSVRLALSVAATLVLAVAGASSAAAADVYVPRVTFTSPAYGSTVSGTITVTGTASDDVGVARVEVRVDGGAYRLAGGTTNWSVAIDTTAYPPGTHNLKARVTDTSGKQAWTDDQIVIASGVDAAVPRVTFTSPAYGSTVSGTITVTGTAGDDVGVARVEVRVDDGAYRLANGTTSWTLPLDTAAFPDGTHNLKARITDTSGKQAWVDDRVSFSNSGAFGTRVSFSSPASGSTVGGTISVAGTALASGGVARVEVKVDDGPYRVASGTTNWSLSLDTTAYAEGAHNLKARVTDLTGKQAWQDDPIVIRNSTSVSGARMYWGALIKGSDYGYGDPPWDMRAVDTFESHAGKKMSLMTIGANWGSSSPNFSPSAMTTIRNHGSIPFFSWAPAGSGDANQPNYQLIDIIGGAYDAYITKFAQDAKAWGHPFFLRFAWEMNLTRWWPWVEVANGNKPGEYVKMWRHVHDIFTRVGASNVNWVWCPNAEYYGSIKPLTSLYPGADYVDWTCIDGYNWGTNPWKPNVWQTFDQVFGPTYANVTGTVAPSKPLVIGETASTEYGGSKAAWITDMLGTQLPQRYPRVEAFVWFNHKDQADWPIETSSSAQSAFSSGIRSSFFAANDFSSLGGSLIPPLSP